jgi:hypothetical protein
VAALHRLAHKLEFDWFEYQGDPVPALAVYRALQSTGVNHGSLCALNDGYCAILRDESPAVVATLGMVCDLLRRNGGDAPSIGERQQRFPDPVALVTAGRGDVIAVCRTIMMATSCGLRSLGPSELQAILPALAFSYARDWDLECSCALLRACAHLHISDLPACGWTRDWLLDQQQADGRFGFVTKASEPESIASTVDAVWTIAELSHPGFLFADA